MKLVRARLVALLAVFCISCGTCFAQFVTNLDLEWTGILGAANANSFGMGAVVFPDGFVYAAGHATGPFDGQSNPGSQNVCVVKWNATGNKIWSKVIGSGGNEYVEGVARDDRNIYIAGYSDGNLGGNTNAGLDDAFLVKLDPDGNVLFKKLWGSTNIDQAYGVAYGPGDPSSVYVAGYTEGPFGESTVKTSNYYNEGGNAFLTKWASDGSTQLWTCIWGSFDWDVGRGVAVSSDGSVYLAGHTASAGLDYQQNQNPGAVSAFLTKFDKGGTSLWTRVWGSISDDYVEDVAVDDSGAIYVVGYTLGEFHSQTNNGGVDAFVSVFDPSGSNLRSRIWGSTNDDFASGVAVGMDSIVRVSGYTRSANFYGHTNQGTVNAFLSLWGSGGLDVTHVLFGGTNETRGTSVALGPDDTAHVPGYTTSGFDGASPVSSDTYFKDLFLSKISEPAPAVQVGTLTIDVTPDSGYWTLIAYPTNYAGRMSLTGDYTIATAPIGTYAARFGAIDYHATPSDASASVSPNISTTIPGVYTPLDSDNDGLTDLDEVNVYGTDPYNPDSDGDGYSDGSEVDFYGSDPLNADSYPRGDLVFSSPVAGVRAKAGKRMPVAWSGSNALGQADIFLAKGTSFWSLAMGVSSPSPYSSNTVTLPRNLHTGSNYHVKVIASAITVWETPGATFGESDLFSIVSDCKGDYDADGKADLSMYFPPWGMWFILRSNKGFCYQQFGWDGPNPVPADYDGDGRTDLAVHDPVSGYWYVLTWNYRFFWLQWGTSMVPVPADYDGDGRIEFAAYDESSGAWHIMRWSGISYVINLGGPGYQAVPGDYDGNGMANAAVYHMQDGAWYILSSSGYHITTIQLGGPGMTAVPNDFDGDGIMDPAVYDSATGTWYIYKSATGTESVQFGFTDAIPVSGDYDGDGKADLGVVYGPLGLWYRLLSADGTVDYLQFGWSGIIPLE